METEKRLIDARYLTSQMYLICEACQTENIFIDAIVDEIDNAPDVDAVEVVHSEWFLNGDGSGSCTNCGKMMEIFYDDEGCMKFYPNCGAKMDGVSDG